jgi:hypothetical protein
MRTHRHPHWTTDDLKRLETATTYGAMKDIAFDILRRIPPPVAQVCGPISTGGCGSIEENLKAFGEAIADLVAHGKNVFDQRPFEEPMQRAKVIDPTHGYDLRLLDDFYLPLFESGLVHELYFLPGWESSRGARWEHEQAQRLGITIVYLDA